MRAENVPVKGSTAFQCVAVSPKAVTVFPRIVLVKIPPCPRDEDGQKSLRSTPDLKVVFPPHIQEIIPSTPQAK
jgi:hypothetical protein